MERAPSVSHACEVRRSPLVLRREGKATSTEGTSTDASDSPEPPDAVDLGRHDRGGSGRAGFRQRPRRASSRVKLRIRMAIRLNFRTDRRIVVLSLRTRDFDYFRQVIATRVLGDCSWQMAVLDRGPSVGSWTRHGQPTCPRQAPMIR